MSQLHQMMVELTGLLEANTAQLRAVGGFLSETLYHLDRQGDAPSEILVPLEALADKRRAWKQAEAHGNRYLSRQQHLCAGHVDIEIHPFLELVITAKHNRMNDAKLPWPPPQQTKTSCISHQVWERVRTALEEHCAAKRSIWFTKAALAKWAGMSLVDVAAYLQEESRASTSDVQHAKGSKWYMFLPLVSEYGQTTQPISPRFRVNFDRIRIPLVKDRQAVLVKDAEVKQVFYDTMFGLPHEPTRCTP